MKSQFLALFLSALVMAVVPVKSLATEPIILPAPQKTGGKPVLDAVSARTSAPGTGFPSNAISREELSTLLWSASGKNRPDKWTIPFGQGSEPYVDIFVADEKGLYRYAWQDHSLQHVVDGDLRGKINAQGFAKSAAYVLVFVSNKTSLKKRGGSSRNWEKWTHVAVGAMTQHLYLVSDSLGIGARYAETMDVDFVRKTLNIPVGEEPICVFALGKR